MPITINLYINFILEVQYYTMEKYVFPLLKKVRNLAETWAKRFVWVALIHASIAAILSVLFIFPPGGAGKELSRMIAGGSAGIWVFVGYATYILVGFVGLSAWAFVYYVSGETNDWLSLAHLILHNVGLIAPLMIFTAGIQGGSLLLEGNIAAIHPTIVWASVPSGVIIGLLVLGTFIGVANALIASFRK